MAIFPTNLGVRPTLVIPSYEGPSLDKAKGAYMPASKAGYPEWAGQHAQWVRMVTSQQLVSEAQLHSCSALVQHSGHEER